MATYKTTRLAKTGEGIYCRSIGKARNGKGKLVPKRFLLGRDQRQADLASLRLQHLWADLEAQVEGEPEWTPEALAFAEAIRKGERLTLPLDGPHADLRRRVRGLYQPPVAAMINERLADTARMAAARDRYPSVAHTIAFEPADRAEAADCGLAGTAAGMAAAARETARAARRPEAAEVTTHQAIDAYAAEVRRQFTRGGGVTEAGRVTALAGERLKKSIANLPLEAFDLDAVKRARDYWTARPDTAHGRPVAIATVQTQIRALRRFIHWMDESPRFEWLEPRRVDRALRVNYRRLRTPEEKAAAAQGVKTWTVDELAILYAAATDHERTLMLLGLNCGFTQIDIVQLRVDEVHADHIARVRGKTDVPGRWLLWPETAQAIGWWRSRHHVHPTLAIVSRTGRPLTRQRIANAWNGLLDRVQKSDPGFRRLAFKHLRKTGAQMIRNAAGGELAGVYLAHGSPVESDALASAYSNPCFDRLAEAQVEVRQQLEPMVLRAFETSPEKPLASRRRRSGVALEPEKIRALRAMNDAGVTGKEIAAALKIDRDTVSRYLDGAHRQPPRTPLTPDKAARVSAMRTSGMTLAQIAAEIGCSIASGSNGSKDSASSTGAEAHLRNSRGGVSACSGYG